MPPISMNTEAAGTSNLDPEVFFAEDLYYLETNADPNFVDPSPALNHQYERDIPDD